MKTALLALLICACPRAVHAFGDRAFAQSLSLERLAQAPAMSAPSSRSVESLYAAPLLQGAANEHISVVAMNDAGDRAVLQRLAPGFLGGSGETVVSVIGRDASGAWKQLRSMSRANGRWIGGVTLRALALSADGRRLVYGRLTDLEDFDSGVLMQLDLDTGGSRALGGWDNKAAAPRVPSKERCAEELRVSLEGRQALVLARAGEKATYGLQALLGGEAWAFQSGDWKRAASADCRRALITVEELFASQGDSLFFGGKAYNARMRVLEVGVR
jgi:hypothetical protein